MGSELLQTKLYIPPSRPGIVPRPQLIERLNEGIKRKLILVCAPAGFGKTTLISNWIETIDLPAAWVSLDKGDNDQNSFLIYLVAAIQTIDRGVCETVQTMLHTPQPPPIESILKELINEVASLSQEFLVVLDDYQVIDDHAIDDALTFMFDYLPPVMHLVIISRSDPMLPLSRLRARNQMTELRTEELRFSTREATDFLNRMMGLKLSDQDIAVLESRTEGWIAGLQLAGLSLQNRDDLVEFISDFAGDDRYIIDYLVDEVLAQCARGTKDFLLQTSILDRMSGPLCDVVTGKEGSQKILEGLEQANLFIVPLDNQRHWYRFHHLFVDVLRKLLAESSSRQDVICAHQRASRWYEENDFPIEAMEHALAAQDLENVIRMIELGSTDILMRGQQSLLLKWQEQFPRELVASHPRFCMTIAWAWLSMGHPDEAEECLQLLEGFLGMETVEMFSKGDQAERIDPAIQVFLVEIVVMRIELAIEGGDIPRVFELTRLVLPYLEDDDRLRQDAHLKNLRSVVFFVLGMAYKISGKFGEAAAALSKAAELGLEVGNVYVGLGSVGRLARVQSMQGQLRQAVSTCRRGLKLAQEMVGKHSPVSGQIHAELGNLFYELDDLERALYHLQEGVKQAKPWGFLDAFVPGYTGLARVRAARGNWDGAFSALDELEALGERNPVLVMPAVESLRASLWIARGKVEAADRWIMKAGLDPEGEINFNQLGELIVFARVLIARHVYSEALDLLTRMIHAAEDGGWLGRVIEMHILLAMVHQAKGESDESMIALEQALNIGSPEGYVRVFVNEGEPMKSLLREAETRGIAPDYIHKILKAFETNHVLVEPSSIPALIEPLSERELEVLRLLKTELSGPEIANHLMIALSTLRTHTQNIYSKLGVSNRRTAVRKAEELNLQ